MSLSKLACKKKSSKEFTEKDLLKSSCEMNKKPSYKKNSLKHSEINTNGFEKNDLCEIKTDACEIKTEACEINSELKTLYKYDETDNIIPYESFLAVGEWLVSQSESECILEK